MPLPSGTSAARWLLLSSACLAACRAAPAAAPQAPVEASATIPVDDSLEGVLDQPAPPWTVSQWFNSEPRTLESLRGQVVLVRWFMGTSCPFCSGTAPTLRALDETYRPRGLSVIGMYHHKEDLPLDPDQVAGWIKEYGYTFPVAIDPGWTTLQQWWLRGKERSYTSVSFLLDKQGIVRRVHLGGLLAPQGPEYDALRADIERLLAEPAAAAAAAQTTGTTPGGA
ncbi:MAG: TlpA disulfide reductase family protein [Kofleriaceae bacterium]